MYFKFIIITLFCTLGSANILQAQLGEKKSTLSAINSPAQVTDERVYDSVEVMSQRLLQEEINHFRFRNSDTCLPAQYAGFLFEQIYWRHSLALFPLHFFKTKGLKQMKLKWKDASEKIVFTFDETGRVSSFDEYVLKYHKGYIINVFREKYTERNLETNKRITVYDTTFIYCKQDTLVIANESDLKVYKRVYNTYFKIIEYSNLNSTWANRLRKTEYSLKMNEDGTVCSRPAAYNGAWTCTTDVMNLPFSEYDISPDGPQLSLKVAQTAEDKIEVTYPSQGAKKLSFSLKNGYLNRIEVASKYNIVDTIIVENKYY